MRHIDIKNRNNEIAIMLLNGDSPIEIAKKFYVSTNTVYNIADIYGVKLRKDYSSLPTRAFIILKELFDNDKTMKEIAEELNITPQRVSQIYNEAKRAQIPGLPIR